MTLHDGVRCTVADGVATVTFERPDRNNAMDLAMERRYGTLLLELEADPAVRAIVVTGTGRSFCPGADLGLLAGISENDTADGDAMVSHVQAAAFIGKPVIAAVNGGCAGLGFVIACTADVRFAAAGAKFTTAFSRRGLIAEYGLAHLLPQLIGRGRAMDLLLSGRTFTAEDAESYGLVQSVHTPDELLSAAQAYGQELATYSAPRSMAVMKRQVREEADLTLTESGARAAQLMIESFAHPELKEGLESWAQRRAPEFPPYTPNL
jgi:2-(1,2-epoxy-1,2-dihydrophenyl)acetyl-CoA isomerase